VTAQNLPTLASRCCDCYSSVWVRGGIDPSPPLHDDARPGQPPEPRGKRRPRAPPRKPCARAPARGGRGRRWAPHALAGKGPAAAGPCGRPADAAAGAGRAASCPAALAGGAASLRHRRNGGPRAVGRTASGRAGRAAASPGVRRLCRGQRYPPDGADCPCRLQHKLAERSSETNLFGSMYLRNKDACAQNEKTTCHEGTMIRPYFIAHWL
jgi:hypothetical protein